MAYKVVEKFVSINGEGPSSGKLAVFIRFAGCNLDCSYCDTRWANQEDADFQWMAAEEIYEYIHSTGIRYVTLTGGEPLQQREVLTLLKILSSDARLSVEIETNGSVDLEPFCCIENNPPRFIMDYKLGSSGMEDRMQVKNFQYLTEKDTVKFVIGSLEDLGRTKEIIGRFDLSGRTKVYISPVFGEINMEEIVAFMKEHLMNDVTLQVQLHKIIWHPERRGI
ncbi:MAG: putative 7-carboxy-7-deazaguanine synthase QueE [Bacillota bacterium]